MKKFSIGVDLGGTNLRIAAVEESGNILETITTTSRVEGGRDALIELMCHTISKLSERFKVGSSREFCGICIGVPGIIDMSRGMVRESPNLPGWHEFPVQKEIESRLKTNVLLENDANAAAFGEMWLGAGRNTGIDDLCMITLGTGVGGGLVLGGKVWHGMTGMAGELGHITVHPNGHPCPCGNQGCLEQYASATALKRMTREAIATGQAPALKQVVGDDTENISKRIYELAMAGDGPTQQVFARVGEALGIALAGLINELNLPLYVVGGGMSAAWDAFSPSMMAEIRKRSYIYRTTNPESEKSGDGARTVIKRAVLGGNAGILGAARLAMLHPT